MYPGTPQAASQAAARWPAGKRRLSLRELYLADLDAISGQRPDLSLYRKLAGQDVHLWIDAGLKDEDDLIDLDHTTIVVGLETAAGPDAVRAILDRIDPDRVVLSLDLFEGVPRLPRGADWVATGLEGLSRQILDLGVCRLILPASGLAGEPEPRNCSCGSANLVPPWR